jgi:aspartate kinase
VVSADQIIEEPLVTGLSVCKNQTQVTIYNLPLDSEIVFYIFDEVFKQNFNVDMISLIQTELNLHLSFTLLSSKKDSLNPALTNLCEQYSDSRIEFNEGYSKVSIVGIGMRSSPGVAQRLFKVLKPYHIKMVTTSEIKISCLVREEDTEKIVKCIAEEFDL